MIDNLNKISELNIVYEENNTCNCIFDEDCKYIIPRYQRAYAWEDKEIIQLIDDIKDIDDKASSYYIGSLVVAKSDDKNEYEVVDGQQRLTTLFLLLNYLEIYKDKSKDNNKQQNLSFAFRDKSNNTLKNIQNIISKIKPKEEDVNEKNRNFDEDNLEQSIYNGIKIINDKFTNEKIKKDQFISQLRKVVLFRIEVPDHTDLNRYFETMNTRGEQLAQVDILKATLMSDLNTKYHEIFAKIWDACSDMSGYVQMGFTTVERVFLFGNKWDVYNKDSLTLEEFLDHLGNNVSIDKTIETNTNFAWENIINADKSNDTNKSDNFNNSDNSNSLSAYESIIDFPYFLLHTLRVYVKHKKIKAQDNTDLLLKLLDDKKLLTDFKTVLDKGRIDGKLSIAKEEFVSDFIIFLLKTRYLFDCYIIKRERTNDKGDGNWSLKYFQKSASSSYYYSNTDFKSSEDRYKDCLMIQAALRVSYTSPKIMHWITDILEWLWNHTLLNDDAHLFPDYVENLAANAISDFLTEESNYYNLGVRTPHIVFNVLDYILWKEKPKQGNDFNFEFRNSVEHFYPQHPSEGSFPKWENSDNCVDMFGNLCIVSRSVNSKFSNLSPTSKCRDYDETISKGSLKLRIMAKIVKDNEQWKNKTCKAHQKEMITKLQEFVKGHKCE